MKNYSNFLKLLISIVILIIFFASFSSYKISGKSIKEEKHYSNVTSNDEFADDSVLVVLNSEASYRVEEYSEKDFLDIDCDKVINLTK